VALTLAGVVLVVINFVAVKEATPQSALLLFPPPRFRPAAPPQSGRPVLLFLLLPLAAVFTEASRKGFGAYLAALQEPDVWSAIELTLITAAISVPLNLVFGVAVAWAIAKYEFRGKAFLTTLVTCPFRCRPW
jgi:ABC-type glycerol-3-phosphate transport system permease component